MADAPNFDNTSKQESVLDRDKYFGFHLSGRVLAIPVMRITEIVEYRGVNITHVPTLPEHIHGALNLRGSIIPIIQLSNKLLFEESPMSKRTCIVLLEVNMDGEMDQIGIIVDGVHKVMELHDEDISEVPPLGMDVNPDFISGVTRVNGTCVTLLNVDQVFSAREIAFVGSFSD